MLKGDVVQPSGVCHMLIVVIHGKGSLHHHQVLNACGFALVCLPLFGVVCLGFVSQGGRIVGDAPMKAINSKTSRRTKPLDPASSANVVPEFSHCCAHR